MKKYFVRFEPYADPDQVFGYVYLEIWAGCSQDASVAFQRLGEIDWKEIEVFTDADVPTEIFEQLP